MFLCCPGCGQKYEVDDSASGLVECSNCNTQFELKQPPKLRPPLTIFSDDITPCPHCGNPVARDSATCLRCGGLVPYIISADVEKGLAKNRRFRVKALTISLVASIPFFALYKLSGFLLLAGAVILAIGIIIFAQDDWKCKKCGFMGKPIEYKTTSRIFWIIIFFLLGIIPGVLYLIFSPRGGGVRCPRCDAEN